MNLDQILAFSSIIDISITVLIVMLAIAFKRNFTFISGLTGMGIAVSILGIMFSWGNSPNQVTPLIRIDHYSLFFMGLLLGTGLVVVAFSYDYFKERNVVHEELMLLILTALLGGMVLVSSTHFAAFFIGMETLSVSLFILIGYCFDRSTALEAAIKYLILSGVSSAFILMGMALIYTQSGTLDFAGIGDFIAKQHPVNVMIKTGTIFLVGGVGFKLSLVPFHLWTPDVYEGAPAPVTAFIATLSKGAVFALLLRYFIVSRHSIDASLINVLTLLAILTILGGNVLALLQQNVKRLLAYSSIAHVGYLLIVMVVASATTPSSIVVEAAAFYLTAYFIATLGAFGVVSMLSTEQEEATEISAYNGLFWRKPWLATCFTFMLLSLAGIPLTAGFVGKFYLFVVGVDTQLWGLIALLIIGSGLGLYYYLRIIIMMARDDGQSETQLTQPEHTKPISVIVMAVLNLLLLWYGVFPNQLIGLSKSLL
jgi:NADH-quinone oxidoreductase subunit N